MDLSGIPPPDASNLPEEWLKLTTKNKLINNKLTMDKSIQTVQNFEYCQKQLSTMTLSGATGTSVDVIHDATHRRSTGGARPKTTRTSNANSAGRSRYQQPKSQQTNGTYHKIKDCPTFGKVCHNCGNWNHFQKLCTWHWRSKWMWQCVYWSTI